MSRIEYNNMLFVIGRHLDQLSVHEQLMFMCREKLTRGVQDINNSRSLFEELGHLNFLKIDQLGDLKELLKEVGEWSLLKKVTNFEVKRKKYSNLLEKVIRVFDCGESNELEHLLRICKTKTSFDFETKIRDVRSLFKELESQNFLEFYRLDILIEILRETGKPDLLTEIEEFEKRINEEEELKRKKAPTSGIFASGRNLGGRVIGGK
ncbi:uncharacterized protein LOC111347565 [Stylophora pistillata]|nr:uncharacterized protein LOC111347565 [Stylophora pistillata]